MTLVFEDRDTIRFQIQEMLRVERIVQPEKVQHEIETYNALLPGAGEVAATLFIEITDKDQIKPVLDRFMGIDTGRHVWMEMAAASGCPVFEAGHSTRRRGSSPRSTSCASPSPTRRWRPSGARRWTS